MPSVIRYMYSVFSVGESGTIDVQFSVVVSPQDEYTSNYNVQISSSSINIPTDMTFVSM